MIIIISWKQDCLQKNPKKVKTKNKQKQKKKQKLNLALDNLTSVEMV